MNKVMILEKMLWNAELRYKYEGKGKENIIKLTEMLADAKFDVKKSFTGMDATKSEGRLSLDVDYLLRTFKIVNDKLVCSKTGKSATWVGSSDNGNGSNIFVTIDKKIYQVHRIVYAMTTGKDIQSNDVRKIDKDYTNYAFSNLELV